MMQGQKGTRFVLATEILTVPGVAVNVHASRAWSTQWNHLRHHNMPATISHLCRTGMVLPIFANAWGHPQTARKPIGRESDLQCTV